MISSGSSTIWRWCFLSSHQRKSEAIACFYLNLRIPLIAYNPLLFVLHYILPIWTKLGMTRSLADRCVWACGAEEWDLVIPDPEAIVSYCKANDVVYKGLGTGVALGSSKKMGHQLFDQLPMGLLIKILQVASSAEIQDSKAQFLHDREVNSVLSEIGIQMCLQNWHTKNSCMGWPGPRTLHWSIACSLYGVSDQMWCKHNKKWQLDLRHNLVSQIWGAVFKVLRDVDDMMEQ